MLQALLNVLSGKKTYLISLATILYAVVVLGWHLGEWEAAGKMVLEALGLGALRAGISKK